MKYPQTFNAEYIDDGKWEITGSRMKKKEISRTLGIDGNNNNKDKYESTKLHRRVRLHR